MKPTSESEGVDVNKTSENLPYPNPNIERDKVIALANSLGGDDENLIMALVSSLTVSEKRADEMERELTAQMVLAIETKNRLVAALGSLEKQLATAEHEHNSLRSSLMRVREKLTLIENECENSLTGRLAAHYYLANIHAMVRTALQASGDG